MSQRDRLFEVFLDVQRGLPRQGPGCKASTLEGLALCSALPERPDVLDIGCGPGMQTVTLASALRGSITAVDIHLEYLNQLKARAEACGVADRIRLIVGDMNALPFAERSFDLIWSEGAAYIMGFESALTAWKPLLKTGGYIAVSELVWTRPDPPAEAAAFFAEEYPAMSNQDALETKIRTCGYEPIGTCTLPDSAWWDDYYTPLQAKLPAIGAKYAGDETALSVIARTAREIEIRRRHGNWYAYAFVVGRQTE